MIDQTNKTLTTASGSPVSDNQNTITAGQRGPVLPMFLRSRPLAVAQLTDDASEVECALFRLN